MHLLHRGFSYFPPANTVCIVSGLRLTWKCLHCVEVQEHVGCLLVQMSNGTVLSPTVVAHSQWWKFLIPIVEAKSLHKLILSLALES